MAHSERKVLEIKKSHITRKNILDYKNAPQHIKDLKAELKGLEEKKKKCEDEIQLKTDLLFKEFKLRAREKAYDLRTEASKKLVEALGSLAPDKKELSEEDIALKISSKEAEIKKTKEDIEIKTEWDYFLTERSATKATLRMTVIENANKENKDAVEKARATNSRVSELNRKFDGGRKAPAQISGKDSQQLKASLERQEKEKVKLLEQLEKKKQDTERRSNLKKESDDLNNKADEQLRHADDYKNQAIDSVRKDLRDFEPEKKKAINDRKTELAIETEKLNTQIKGKTTLLEAEEAILKSSSPVLRELAEKPEDFYNRLFSEAKKVFATYKRTCPKNVNDQKSSRQKLQPILEEFERFSYEIDTSEAKRKQPTNTLSYENKCFILCGFLYTLRDQINRMPNVSGQLTSLLSGLDSITVLSELHEEDTRNAYYEYSSSSLKPSNPPTLIEELRYSRSVKELKETLDLFKRYDTNKAIDKFCQLADSLIINSQVDSMFLANIYKRVNQLIHAKADNNQEKIKKYSECLKQLANQIKDEQPSTCMIGTGIVAMILSALAFALGVVAKFVTFGLSAPASNPLIVGGIVGFFGGAKLYRVGRKHTGTSAHILDIETAVNKVTFDEATLGSKGDTAGFWVNLKGNRNLVSEVKIPVQDQALKQISKKA